MAAERTAGPRADQWDEGSVLWEPSKKSIEQSNLSLYLPVLDRFRQIEPKVLIAVDGYSHNGRRFDRRDAVSEISANLPSLSKTVLLAHETEAGSGAWMDYDELTTSHQPLDFEPVAFDHPLWILYSSGTTGLPKAIVHGPAAS